MNIDIKEICRNNRKNQTLAEKKVWDIVRNRKCLNLKFYRQYPIKFEIDEKNKFFIADFYCQELKLIIEIDGGYHIEQQEYDELRTFFINQLGIKVFRFKNEHILENEKIFIKDLKVLLSGAKDLG